MLTGGGVQEPLILADIICEQALICTLSFFAKYHTSQTIISLTHIEQPTQFLLSGFQQRVCQLVEFGNGLEEASLRGGFTFNTLTLI